MPVVDAGTAEGPSGLPAEVEARIKIEVRQRGQRIIDCLMTATWMLRQTADDEIQGLRLAESAAYNLREALDGVVNDRVLAAAMAERERSSERARQLLGFLRAKSGVEPLRGELDPVSHYSDLLTTVNDATHGTCERAEAIDLLDRTVNWFVRMFTTPDAQVRAILRLATARYTGPEQLDQLKAVVVTPHHLRLLFARLVDPAWLLALHDAGLVSLPRSDEPWPVSAITDGLGRTHPREVAALLQRLMVDTRATVTDQLAGVRFELLRTAIHLGEPGHSIVSEVVRRHGDVQAVRSLSIQVALDAKAEAQIVLDAARAVVRKEIRLDQEWGVRELLDRLDQGLTAENVSERVRFLAGKLRLFRDTPYARYPVDLASLRAGIENEREITIVLAHYLVRLLRHSRALEASTADLQAWVKEIPGPIGERIACQLYPEGTDGPLAQRTAPATRRLGSATARGDDRDLVRAILAANPGQDQLGPWRVELGAPSLAAESADRPDPFPDDWVRVWRWSAVLPAAIWAAWAEHVRLVSATCGEPPADTFDHRFDQFEFTGVQSPYSRDDLAALAPSDAASQVAAWRPNLSAFWPPTGSRELARAVEALVTADIPAWTEDPLQIITLLHEPLYVLHYLRALTSIAAQLGDRAPAVLDAIERSRTARPTPTPLGSDDGYDYELTWDGVDVAAIDLIEALAKTNGELGEHIGLVWERVLEATRHRPDPADAELRDILGDRDALHSAINHPWSKGLQAAVALARWEAAHAGPIRTEFAALLDEVIEVGGTAGLEYRAILAAVRPQLEVLVPAWLDDRADRLFRTDDHGAKTFDLTLKWSRATPWLLERFRSEIYAAARRGAANALSHLLIATLNGHPGYATTEVIDQFRRARDVLHAAIEEVPALLQQADSDSPQLVVGVNFWRAFLDADRRLVPVDVLSGAGRWVFVGALPDDQWLSLTARTLELTHGRLDHRFEVVNRCGALPLDETTAETAMQMLALLVDAGDPLEQGDAGDPWEQSYVRDRAVDLLRRASEWRRSPEFVLLRTRLLELGRHEVADLGDDSDDPAE